MYVITDDSTQHGLQTPHGPETPHRFPRAIPTPVDFFAMVDLLYPTGRAWDMPSGSNFSNLHAAFNDSFLQVAQDAFATLDNTFPDNENFDANDADIWEYRLGIPYNSALTLDQRRQAIYRKIAFPQNIKARQHYLYIQDMLNLAGFNVKVYENIYFDGGGHLYQKTPQEVLNVAVQVAQFGPPSQFGGGMQFGGGGYQVIANSDAREVYTTGGILWPTFFIGGDPIGSTAVIEKSREKEFRTLVLKLKPAHTVAFIFVTYGTPV